MSAIIPAARTFFVDTLGRPLASGLVYTYAQGTTTAKLTYRDRALTIANTNPIVLDTAGTTIMWGTGAYSLVVATPIGGVVFAGDSFADNFDGTAVTITGGTIDGVAIGATTAAAGRFTTLTITGGIDATTIGLTTPTTAQFTSISTTGTVAVGGNETVTGTLGVTGLSTLATATIGALTVTGAATVAVAVATTSAVRRSQVLSAVPISAKTVGTAILTVTALTGTFTAPCAGQLVIQAQGQCTALNLITAITLTTSLAGIVAMQSAFLGATAVAYAYLPMNSGDATTVSSVLTAVSSTSLNILISASFQPTP